MASPSSLLPQCLFSPGNAVSHLEGYYKTRLPCWGKSKRLKTPGLSQGSFLLPIKVASPPPPRESSGGGRSFPPSGVTWSLTRVPSLQPTRRLTEVRPAIGGASLHSLRQTPADASGDRCKETRTTIKAGKTPRGGRREAVTAKRHHPAAHANVSCCRTRFWSRTLP